MIPLHVQSFCSSPTANRGSFKTVISLMIMMKFKIGMVDISQAFLQSSEMEPTKRLLLIPPDSVTLPWTGKMTTVDKNNKDYAFLMRKPLYGIRDAPTRWFLKLSERFRSYNFRQIRTDCCLYHYFNDERELSLICLVHVDDILAGGTEQGWKVFREAVDTFKHGEYELLEETKKLTFLGIAIHLLDDGGVSLD